jgi:hypothetical protein
LQNDGLAPTALRIQAAAGKSYTLGNEVRGYILADSVTSLNSTSYLAVGPTAGAIWAITPRLRTEVVTNAYWNALGDQQDSLLYKLSASLAWDVFNNQNNMRLNVVRQMQNNTTDTSRTFTDVQLAYFHYF